MLIKSSSARGLAVIAGMLAPANIALAQGAEPAAPQSGTANLPPLEVTAKKSKKKAAAKAKAPAKQTPAPAPQVAQTAPVEPNDAAAFPASGVSGPATPGAQQINITGQDLARNNPTDVSDVFKGEPGIAVGSSVPMSQKVYVHGIEETNLAVTIDGSAQNNKVFHHNGTNLIDPGLLKAVRVDAGVAPADAGFGALAGSIAYETKDVGDFLAGDGVGGFNKSVFNTNGNVFVNSTAAYAKARGFEALGYFSFGDGDDFENGDGDRVLGTETNYLTGLGKLAYQSETGDRIEISHEQLHDDALRPYRANAGFIEVPSRPWEPRVRNYELNRSNTIFTYSDATPTALWDPKVVIAYSRTDVSLPSYACPRGCPTGIPIEYPTSGESDNLNGKFENRFSFALGTLTAGVDFQDREGELVANSDVLRFSDDSREESFTAGAYAQARIEPWRGTRLSFGGRGDHQRFTGTNDRDWNDGGFSGNVSGEQDLLGDWLTAKAGYSHVWAGIPLAENFIMNPFWAYADDPEAVEADNVTAGLKARYRGFTLEGTVFRTEIDNARVATYGSVIPLSGGLYSGAFRTRDIDSRGFEIGTGYDWGFGFIRAKYAHIDIDVDGQPADSDTGNYVAVPVGDIITITAAHRFERIGLTVGGDIEIAPEYDRVAPPAVTGEDSPPYPAYEVVNLFAEYQPQNLKHDLTFRLDVRNLFNELYASRATYGSEFGNVTPLYEPGRSFLFTTTAKF